MKKARITANFFLFKINNINVELNPSWFVIFLLVTYSIFATVLPDYYPTGGLQQKMILSICFSFLFFSSLFLHELAHSLVANRIGIGVQSIVFHLFGGTARILREPKDPASEVKMAAAGPLTSMALSLVFFVLHKVFSLFAPVSGLLFYLLSFANLAVATFNLLPAFPLDGGRLIRSFLWKVTKNRLKSTIWSGRFSQLLAVLLFFAGISYGFNYSPDGFWLSLVAVVVFMLGRESITAAYQNEILEKPVSEILSIENVNNLPLAYFYELDYPSVLEVQPNQTVYDLLTLLKEERPYLVKYFDGEKVVYLKASTLYDLLLSILENARDVLK